MKAIATTLSMIVLLLASAAPAQVIPVADFYVATDGDDAAEGSEMNPFATLGRAQEAVRELIGQGLTSEVFVYLREGTYFLEGTLTFGPLDSGTAQFGVTYAAYPGEVVSINGGLALGADWFVDATDSDVLSRLPRESAGRVKVADLWAHGIADTGEMIRRGFSFNNGPFDPRTPPAGLELFFNGRPMQLARWPNSDYQRVAGLPDGPDGFRFTYSGFRPRRWTQAPDPWLYGHWNAFWADAYLPIESIDTQTRTIAFTPVTPEEMEQWGWDEGNANGGYGIEKGRPYFAINLLEEIDRPGEWYLDRASGKLYFYPPSDLEGASIQVSMLDTLIRLEEAAYITFRNLTLEVSRDNLVEVIGGNDVRFYRCLLRNAGTSAAAVGGYDNGVTGCEITGVGDGGVGFSGGDRFTLTESGNYLHNCRVHHYGRWSRMYTTAALIEDDRDQGVGVSIQHNLIHDAPHMAVLFQGNEHTIAYNEFHDLCRDADDAGVIYVGRDWGARGTVILHNFFHDIYSDLRPFLYGELWSEGVHAVYFDDTSCGNEVVGNIIYDVQTRGVMVGGGRDNLVANNVISDCGRSGLFIDRRGMARTPEQNESLLHKIERYNYTEPPWSERYPLLAVMMENDPYEPVGNMIHRNLGHDNLWWMGQGMWGSSVIDWLTGVPRGFLDEQDNIEDCEDPRFVDEEAMNLELRPDSPAFSIPGFEWIPFSEIGMLPEVPAVYLFVEGEEPLTFEEGGLLSVRGTCEPWAQVASAFIDGRDVTGAIAVGPNGALSGLIDLDRIVSSPVVLEVIVADPKGHVSEPGASNPLEVTGEAGNDDDSTDDDDDDTEACGS